MLINETKINMKNHKNINNKNKQTKQNQLIRFAIMTYGQEKTD